MGLRVAFAPGVTPAKWFRVWQERLPAEPLEPIVLPTVLTATDEAVELLRTDAADLALVRLPVPGAGFNAIPLYDEVPVAVVPKDHEASLLEEVSFAELGGLALARLEAGSDTGAAVELVAAGVGYVVLPKSVARLHSRRDVVALDLTGPGAEELGERVALVWRAGVSDERAELVDEFVGIVRGRTANSTRGAATTEAIAAAKAQRPTAAAKARAAEARAAAAKKGGPKSSAKKPARGAGGAAAARSRKRRPR
jgi:DNA-binding transcriptional LysR family regulator